MMWRAAIGYQGPGSFEVALVRWSQSGGMGTGRIQRLMFLSLSKHMVVVVPRETVDCGFDICQGDFGWNSIVILSPQANIEAIAS